MEEEIVTAGCANESRIGHILSMIFTLLCEQIIV